MFPGLIHSLAGMLTGEQHDGSTIYRKQGDGPGAGRSRRCLPRSPDPARARRTPHRVPAAVHPGDHLAERALPHPPRSRHPGGVNVAFCDGSIRFIADVTDGQQLRALLTKDGRERVGGF